ncbi:histidinol-phosphate transaminase [Alkaliphilus peptidifermentans]|uniref:Histidinol-phosphate aminotransferase n=1 Tax=Alkaliphilus peptidifermentans DSM 18978 TaxID=1120976 RepID=A0A1G5KYG4_9FIRM|nr:histidinol-phosphate transaminase [Alkaliphilus peptidifermentans]SCZ05733.1 histidinol phosphate aminotransferase apoenzyme [Alkaliphilus peptidifermentans DSM 18978]
MTLKFRPEIKDLVPYKPGKPIEDVKKEYGLTEVIKLASNENPLGSSPKAKEAVVKSVEELHLYPDGNSTDLKEAIANFFGVKATQVLPSSGSDEMVDQISKTFINHGDEIIIADVTFPRYLSTAIMMGGTPVVVPLKDFTYDLEGMKKAITEKTKLIWLCNPNNPTGTMFTEKELLDFLNAVPKNIIVLYDEAYNEYVTRDDYPKNSIPLLDKYPNVIIMRTFSKIYGLAALRVGYTIASEEIIENINKIRGPFNVNTSAQMAAIAALEDQDFLKESYRVNKEGKEYLYKAFDDMGIWYAPSETNHIFLDAKKDCQEVFTELQKRGMIIRPMYKTYIRVSIGTMDQNKKFIELLKEVLA